MSFLIEKSKLSLSMMGSIKILIVLPLLVFSLMSCTARFACKQTIEGIRCEPITAVYEREMLGIKEDKKKVDRPVVKPVDQLTTLTQEEEVVRRLVLDEKKPVRIPPQIIRIWLAPWEDSDGDLHQPGYVYSEITDKRGRWLFGEEETSAFQPILTPIETGRISDEDQTLRESPKQDSQKN